MWTPTLVALDIDGTLVDRQGVVPAELRAAIGRVVDAGTPIVLATGRSWASAAPVFADLHLPAAPTVCSNGAVTIDLPSARLRDLQTFDPALVIAKVAELAPHALIAIEEPGIGYRVNKIFPSRWLDVPMEVQTLSQLAAHPATRVIIADPDGCEADFVQLAEHLGMAGVSYSVGWSAWLDIAPLGVNKAAALEAVCTGFGVDPGEVLAIGDGRNDIEMLSWAGRGVALGDAPAEVKAAADAVTADFEAGGTALELSRWFTFPVRESSQDARLTA